MMRVFAGLKIQIRVNPPDPQNPWSILFHFYVMSVKAGFCILQNNTRRVQFRRYEYRTTITNRTIFFFSRRPTFIRT